MRWVDCHYSLPRCYGVLSVRHGYRRLCACVVGERLQLHLLNDPTANIDPTGLQHKDEDGYWVGDKDGETAPDGAVWSDQAGEWLNQGSDGQWYINNGNSLTPVNVWFVQDDGGVVVSDPTGQVIPISPGQTAAELGPNGLPVPPSDSFGAGLSELFQAEGRAASYWLGRTGSYAGCLARGAPNQGYATGLAGMTVGAFTGGLHGAAVGYLGGTTAGVVKKVVDNAGTCTF
jgi:hypothetical protein